MTLKDDVKKLSDKELIRSANLYKALCRGGGDRWDSHRYDVLLQELDKRGLIK